MGITIVSRHREGELRTKVVDQLRCAPIAEAESLEVTVAHGVVTLTGILRTYAQKCEAEEAARRVAGVWDVVNNVRVQLRPDQERPDAALARAARHVLEWHSELSDATVEVTVDEGWVTLAGCVERSHHATWAERAVRCLTGVRGVQNECAVEQAPDPDDVYAHIRTVLEQCLGDQARHLSVVVENDEIVLAGPVPSHTHRGDIGRAVGAAPGVSAVQNDLTVNADPYFE